MLHSGAEQQPLCLHGWTVAAGYSVSVACLNMEHLSVGSCLLSLTPIPNLLPDHCVVSCVKESTFYIGYNRPSVKFVWSKVLNKQTTRLS